VRQGFAWMSLFLLLTSLEYQLLCVMDSLRVRCSHRTCAIVIAVVHSCICSSSPRLAHVWLSQAAALCCAVLCLADAAAPCR
jgi:hypothetical protein